MFSREEGDVLKSKGIKSFRIVSLFSPKSSPAEEIDPKILADLDFIQGIHSAPTGRILDTLRRGGGRKIPESISRENSSLGPPSINNEREPRPKRIFNLDGLRLQSCCGFHE